jgi:hypothetical protein
VIVVEEEVIDVSADQGTDSQPHTLDCVYALEASNIILARDPEIAVDEQVNDALVPVLAFCRKMAQYTRGRTQEEDLSSSYSSNILDLRLHMTEAVEDIMNEYHDISIHQLFSNWHIGELPTLLPGSQVVSGHKEQRTPEPLAQESRTQEQRAFERAFAQYQADEEQDLQRAIQESFYMITEQQQGMQEFYQASGGELGARVEGEDEDDVVEIPTLERMLGMIPDSGISFFELTKALGIHNIGTTRLQAVADGVYANTTRKEDGKLYPFQPDEFPSDDDVKDALSRGVRMSLLDLYKVGGVRALGTAKCHEFSNGLIRRGVIVVEDDGSVRVSRDSGKKTSGKDVASRKTTTQDTPSRRLSLPTGSPFDNMPTIGTPRLDWDIRPRQTR